MYTNSYPSLKVHPYCLCVYTYYAKTTRTQINTDLRVCLLVTCLQHHLRSKWVPARVELVDGNGQQACALIGLPVLPTPKELTWLKECSGHSEDACNRRIMST